MVVEYINPAGMYQSPVFSQTMRVAGLANPDFLIEIEAQAVLP